MQDEDQVHNILILVEETVFLKGHTMVMKLIIMDMPNFDTILGMNFLKRYKAKIYYKKKKVRFSPDDDK